uniref:uncharacterized protein si:ch211-243a20.4 n=1 Tax=Oncorhynchus gorbuscha TaxID=8017 RepID=UPI001EAF7798|nr:uncharacterized protein si:ch211-243a20.4 [Oncorhynchus gorbuscha]
MCIWMVGVLCVLMCLGNHQAQEANPAISMPDRIRVALAGETVHYKLKVTIPMNQSSSNLVCSGPPEQKKIKEWIILLSPETKTTTFNLEISAYNSSYSGEYNCKYKNVEIFWTLLVKDEGYRQLYSGFILFIVLGALTTGLLIFSVIGSIYVFKSQWNGSTGSGVSRRNRGENEEEEENSNTSVNAAASAPVYASLESRPASVYEVLTPGAPAAAVNRESVQRKGKVKRKSKESVENATPQGEGIFECVYENF